MKMMPDTLKHCQINLVECRPYVREIVLLLNSTK